MTVTIEVEADRRRPGRTGYRVSGPSRAAVHFQASALLQRPGIVAGEFKGPQREADGQWWALGYTLTEEAQP